jgi:molybdenum cofactor guanylyltransferase
MPSRTQPGFGPFFQATAVILAGGGSRRMGVDKSLLAIKGRPLIAHLAAQLTPHFPEVLVGANDPSKFAFLGLPVIPDEVPDQGPLMGILSCLNAAREDRVLVVACDLPEVNLAFIGKLMVLAEEADIVIPEGEGGRMEPLFALYRKRVAARAAGLLAQGHRRITDLLPGLEVARPAMPPGWYFNLNTPADFEAYLRRIRRE